jgi:hypothetical protein
MVRLDKLEESLSKLCLNRFGYKRCGVNINPEVGSEAYKDLNPYDQEDARENRRGPCEIGSTFCKPSYSRKKLPIVKWTIRLMKDMN